MAKKPAAVRRKLVEFDAQTWQALDLLARDSMKAFQELADEAFRDLLRKYDRPTDLKAALRWPPREIQLSWANVSGMTRARPAKTSANRARLPNMGTSLSLSRPGSRSSHAHSPWFPDSAGCRQALRTRLCG